MGKEVDWKRVSKLRKIIKDRRTKVQKSRNGNVVGGKELNDETIKPYLEELAELEAKIAKDKEQMSTGERVDAAAQEAMANDDQNTADTQQFVHECFARAFPNKFRNGIHKWAYVDAKGSGDYYKRPDGTVHPRTGEIPEGCTFAHKVRVQECIDKDLDIYKYWHEDGTADHATGLASFVWINLVGLKVTLKKCALPKALEKFADAEGTITNEPDAKKPPRDNDIFDVSFGKAQRKVKRKFLDIVERRDTSNVPFGVSLVAEKKRSPKAASLGAGSDVSTCATSQPTSDRSYTASSSKDAQAPNKDDSSSDSSSEDARPTVHFEGKWNSETKQRIQPLIDEVIRIIDNISLPSELSKRLEADLARLNKYNDNFHDTAVWDLVEQHVVIRNSKGKKLCTITPATSEKPACREEAIIPKAPWLNVSRQQQPASSRPGWANEMQPTVRFETKREKDRERVRPIIDEVKRILSNLGSTQNDKFEKRLEDELKSLNEANGKNGLQDTVVWSSCVKIVEINDVEDRSVCTIIPDGVQFL